MSSASAMRSSAASSAKPSATATRPTNPKTTRMAREPRPVFVLRLTPLPGIDGILALRAVLKTLLRHYGMRCLSVREEREPCTPAKDEEPQL